MYCVHVHNRSLVMFKRVHCTYFKSSVITRVPQHDILFLLFPGHVSSNRCTGQQSIYIPEDKSPASLYSLIQYYSLDGFWSIRPT